MHFFIKAAIIKNNTNTREVAKALGIHYNTLMFKIAGKKKFTIKEALILKDLLFKDKDLEYVCKRLEEESNYEF